MDNNVALPPPPAELAALSRQLRARILARIDASGGWLDFAEFMQMALYEPGLGYYSAGARKFGPDGDFVTAPEISPLFARCLANAIAPVLARLTDPVVMEIGAGSGALARELLPALASLGQPPAEYLVLEVSADLRERQRNALAGLDEELAARIRWLDRLPPAGLHGVLLANEVLDALPFNRFCWRGGRAVALGVGRRDRDFVWREAGPDDGFHERVAGYLGDSAGRLDEGYRSEFRAGLDGWLAAVSASLERGAFLLSDYGLTRRDYYDPARRDGTLICHYRHRAHADPFLYPGAQDISAWVDFSAVAEAGRRAGLDPAGFATQAGFLLANGLESIAGGSADAVGRLQQAGALRRLLLPGEMGEYFKFMLFTRGLPPGSLDPGRDLSDRL